jgi:hypothetical protein
MTVLCETSAGWTQMAASSAASPLCGTGVVSAVAITDAARNVRRSSGSMPAAAASAAVARVFLCPRLLVTRATRPRRD